MLSNVYVDVDKEHRLRKWTPINVIKYSYRRKQGASFLEVDAFKGYQLFIAAKTRSIVCGSGRLIFM